MPKSNYRLNDYCVYCGRYLHIGKRKYCGPLCEKKAKEKERERKKAEKAEAEARANGIVGSQTAGA